MGARWCAWRSLAAIIAQMLTLSTRQSATGRRHADSSNQSEGTLEDAFRARENSKDGDLSASYFNFYVWVPYVRFYVRRRPHTTAFRFLDARVKVISPDRLRQFSVGEKQIMKWLTGVWEFREEESFTPSQMKVIRIHESNVFWG